MIHSGFDDYSVLVSIQIGFDSVFGKRNTKN